MLGLLFGKKRKKGKKGKKGKKKERRRGRRSKRKKGGNDVDLFFGKGPRKTWVVVEGGGKKEIKKQGCEKKKKN